MTFATGRFAQIAQRIEAANLKNYFKFFAEG